jgi:hypothetical protein
MFFQGDCPKWYATVTFAMEDDMNVQNTSTQSNLFSFTPTSEVDGTVAASIQGKHDQKINEDINDP